MSETLKQIFATIAVGGSFISIVFYMRAILRGEVRPHIFSWLLWTLVMGTVFVAQLKTGAGVGASLTAADALECFGVALLALRHGERKGTRSDWVAMIVALLAIPLWVLTNNPLLAVILLTVIDCLGFYPTFRKDWHKPHEESASWAIRTGALFALALLALENYNWTTFLYPVAMVIAHVGLGILLLWRRRITH